MERLRRSRIAVALLLAYGVATLAVGVLILAHRPTVEQTFEAVLFALIGLLALTGGILWARAQRRSSH